MPRRRCRNRKCQLSFRTDDWNEWYCSQGCRSWATRQSNEEATRLALVAADPDDDPDRPAGDPKPEEILELASKLRPPGRRPQGPRYDVLLKQAVMVDSPRTRFGRIN